MKKNVNWRIFIFLYSIVFFIEPANCQVVSTVFAAFKNKTPDNVLVDFSYAGYKHGEQEIPNVSLPLFNVTAFGAFPNDNVSDKHAIQNAINAAQRSTVGGIVFFPPGKFLVNELSDNSNSITITSSNIVLRGSGSGTGGTEIFMYTTLGVANPSQMWTGFPMFNIMGTRSEGYLTTITGNETIGSYNLKVANASRIRADSWIQLNLTQVDNNLINNELYGQIPNSTWSNLLSVLGVNVFQNLLVKSVNGNNLTFYSPIGYDINITNNWKLSSFNPIENIGIESIKFSGNFTYPFQHHRSWQDDSGWPMVNFKRTANSWVKDCIFNNVSNGVTINYSTNLSVLNCSITGNPTHEAISSCTRSTYVLIGKCKDLTYNASTRKYGMHHSFGVAGNAINSVIWRCDYPSSTSFECHASQPRNTLWDVINGGFNETHCGGAEADLPHHMQNLTLWNFNKLNTNNSSLNFWTIDQNGMRVPGPIVVGFHGVSTNTFSNVTQLKKQEAINNTVFPISLYEAQMQLRLGTLPNWIRKNNAIIWKGSWSETPTKFANLIIDAPLTIDGTNTNNVYQFGDVTINPNASLTIKSNQNLSITGSIFNNGTILGLSNSGLNFTGTTLQSIIGTNLISLENININNSVAGVVLQSPMAISGILLLKNGAKFTTTGYNFTLLSSSVTGFTARIGAIPANAKFFGNKIIMQRYIGSKKANRLISSPFTNANLQQLKPTIVVTGPNGSANGFDDALYNPPTLRYYVETIAGIVNVGYQTASNINFPFQVGTGYQLFIRGDRNNVNSKEFASTAFSSAASDVVITLSGTINQGNVTVNLNFTNTGNSTNDGWNLIGNPYPSEISFENYTFPANVSLNIYLWDPQSSNTTLTTIAGRYITYQKGTGCSPNIVNCRKIASMQGFFVKATAKTNIVFTESMKTVTSANLFRTEGIANHLVIDLNPENENTGTNDQTHLIFEDGASKTFEDDKDALKMMNTNGTNISTWSEEGMNLVFNKIGTLIDTNTVKIPLIVNSGDSLKTIQFSGTNSFDAGTILKLYDNLTNSYTNIQEGTKVVIKTNKADTATTSPKRLSIVAKGAKVDNGGVLTKNIYQNESIFDPKVEIYPNPSKDGRLNIISDEAGMMEIHNQIGQIVLKTTIGLGINALSTNLRVGIYFVKVKTHYVKWVIKP